MKTKKFVLAVTLTVIFSMLLTTLALAAAIEVDHFNSGDPILLTATNGQNEGFSAGAGNTAIGGERDLILSRASGTASASFDIISHYLRFTTGPGNSTAQLQIQYDGPDNSITLNPLGLGGVDFDDGVNTGFHIEVVFNQTPVNLTIQVYTDATHWSQNTLTIPAGINAGNRVDFFMRFTQFNTTPPGAAGPVNFNSVGAIVLVMTTSSPNADFRLDYVEVSNKEEYGDLPATYGNASHVSNGMRLGSNLDTEPQSWNILPAHANDAFGDDLEDGVTIDDEDGVVRTPNVNWAAGPGGGSVDVTVKDCLGSCFLNAWFDWNNNGDFNDASEFGIFNFPLSNGVQTITFNIPLSAPINNGSFYSRFRLFTFDPGGLASPVGDLIGGEVEDYQWAFGPTAVTLASLQAFSNPTSAIFAWLVLGVLACAAILFAATFFRRRRA
jgi:hypothetical protein